MIVESEPHSSKSNRQRITENISSLAQTMWNYDPVDITWQQDRAFKLGLEIYDHAYVAFKEPRK